METIDIKAYAKINLGLEVLRKRPDGLHDINTVFTRINLFDEIKISPADDLSVICEPDLNIPPQDNIVYKTASKIQKDFNLTGYGAKISIQKNIPAGAGMGGGSSDAAAVLKNLVKIWNINASYEYLLNTAASLGADVPFFLSGKTALARGIGEQLEELNVDLLYHVVVVYPNVNISTKWAYESLKRDSSIHQSTDFKSLIINNINDFDSYKSILRNDFENIVFERYPEIGEIKKKLYENGAGFALMSGSGSSVYGLFIDADTAKRASGLFSQYKTYYCEPLEN